MPLAGAAEHGLGGATPATAIWSHDVAGWESALATVSQASGLVATAGAATIRTPAGDHRKVAWLQAFDYTAALASAAWGWRAVHRPLRLLNALGRVERWQSPVDRARLEIV